MERSLVIELEGNFDGRSARDVRGRLAALPRDVRVVLDFSRVREFADAGVAVMAQALEELGSPRVVMRGLRQHQHRLFRYLGVDPEALAAGVGSSAAGA
ncbi:STAS domain-containing protein [Anaeromyxobacter paludicola]|uniref:STAS domain-containing protein n=1 Tax=Anaeromyxobacter paludicola TaxID=2918171 RepID=UPI0020C05A77|nr:STAS domain-containing protein [Anaeromyxobacter paludicola]